MGRPIRPLRCITPSETVLPPAPVFGTCIALGVSVIWTSLSENIVTVLSVILTFLSVDSVEKHRKNTDITATRDKQDARSASEVARFDHFITHTQAGSGCRGDLKVKKPESATTSTWRYSA